MMDKFQKPPISEQTKQLCRIQLAASDSIRIGIKVAGKGRGADKKNYFYF
jgi:hypothetical protein